MPPGPICRVAVLPFVNDSDFPLADAIVGKVFTTQLQESGDFLVNQEGDIVKVYQQQHILPGVAPTSEQLQIIANQLHAQLLISGIVLEMRVNNIDINDMVYVFQDGSTVWYVEYIAQITEFFDNLPVFEQSVKTFRPVKY